MFIRKKKLIEILSYLEKDSADQTKATGDTEESRIRDFYWRCGNANAVNFIKYTLSL